MMLQKNFGLWMRLALIIVFSLSACISQSVDTLAPAPAMETPSVSPHVEPRVLNVLHPQVPTTLNLHLSAFVKDMEPARIVYEPLADFDKDGKLNAILADAIPSFENGQLAKDGKSVTWTLRQDVLWSDGVKFTAKDVVFTYRYVTNPDVKAATAKTYAQIADVVAVDDYTVQVFFKDITPGWAVPFVGNGGVIIPEHIFSAHTTTATTEGPNVLPIGTGPYKITSEGIKPQEVLLLGSQIVKTIKIVFVPNEHYRFPDKISFDRIIWRGGGTADEAARLSLEQGAVNLAYDLDFVDPKTLSELQKSGKGKLVTVFGSGVERIYINHTDPIKPSEDGEYSSIEVPHRFFSDKLVRQAFAHAMNRDALAALYGANGLPTHVNLIAPPQYRSSSEFYEYDLEKAKALLDEAGFIYNGEFRERDGVKLSVKFQSAVNAIQQEEQKIIQKDLNSIGVDVELVITDSSIMFGAGSANTESASRFNADMMIFRYRSLNPDPTAYMENWLSTSIPQKANNWTGVNYERWQNPAYDELLNQTRITLDVEERNAMFIRLNDMLVEDVVMIPLVWRASALGISQNLVGLDPTPWDSITWNIQDWKFSQP